MSGATLLVPAPSDSDETARTSSRGCPAWLIGVCGVGVVCFQPTHRTLQTGAPEIADRSMAPLVRDGANRALLPRDQRLEPRRGIGKSHCLARRDHVGIEMALEMSTPVL